MRLLNCGIRIFPIRAFTHRGKKMIFIQKSEKTLVKSLLYGLIGGLYFSILFVSRTEEIDSGEGWRTFTELSGLEYFIKVLQVSILISIGTFIIVLLYLYFRKSRWYLFWTGRTTVSWYRGIGMEDQFFVGWGTLTLINAGLAQGKNRSGLNWFFISLFCGFVCCLFVMCFS